MLDQLTFLFSSARHTADRGRLKETVSASVLPNAKKSNYVARLSPWILGAGLTVEANKPLDLFSFIPRRLAVPREIAKAFAPACNKRLIRRRDFARKFFLLAILVFGR